MNCCNDNCRQGRDCPLRQEERKAANRLAWILGGFIAFMLGMMILKEVFS